MGSFTSIFTGVSGLNANSAQLSVIGNNVANMNTVGFKSNRTNFKELIRSSLAPNGAGPVQTGGGIAVGPVQLNYAQGPIGQTGNPMDWTIDGRGFFVVKNAAGNTFYSRAGQFKLNVDTRKARVVNPDGLVLQGFLADDRGTVGSTVSDFETDSELAGKATAAISLRANLDASVPILSGTFDAADPSTYSFSTSQTIYDSRDVTDSSHTLILYFIKTDANTWDVHGQADNGAVSAGSSLVFTEEGALSSGDTQTLSLTVPAGETSLSQSVTLDLTGTTQYGIPSSVLTLSQDGYNQGTLQSISTGTDGIITGNYSNQRHQTLGQVALASFEDPQGLTQVGQNLLVESEASGSATNLKPGSAWTLNSPLVGNIQAGALELSNVDLGENFVDMIAAQFGFQASSRAIKTTDEILQVVMSLQK